MSTPPPLPQNAVKVFEGKFVDVYDWEQELFDGTTKIFQSVRRLPGWLCIPVVWDKILLAYQQQPRKEDWYWWHIWWNFDRWEDPLEGIKRELLEETWMISDSIELRRHYSNGRIINTEIYYFIVRDLKKIQEQKLDEGWERLEVREVSFDDYINLLIRWECGWHYWREEVMLMKIDNKLEDFRRHLFWLND